mmetsp:Transcript_37824/g.65356  ORF Transcript_37824/g.65356 Transcript_37824/m.65356 type:complete len:242 (-) Transcript_37824:2084-2809(-)
MHAETHCKCNDRQCQHNANHNQRNVRAGEAFVRAGATGWNGQRRTKVAAVVDAVQSRLVAEVRIHGTSTHRSLQLGLEYRERHLSIELGQRVLQGALRNRTASMSRNSRVVGRLIGDLDVGDSLQSDAIETCSDGLLESYVVRDLLGVVSGRVEVHHVLLHAQNEVCDRRIGRSCGGRHRRTGGRIDTGKCSGHQAGLHCGFRGWCQAGTGTRTWRRSNRGVTGWCSRRICSRSRARQHSW